MRGFFNPARSRSRRIASRFGVWANFTYTSVPPLKSIPSGNGEPVRTQRVPIEIRPATLKIREKARKYHFLPRKSMLVLRKNSTASPLNTQSLATLVAAEDGFENDPRHKHRGEQVRQQTKTQRDGKSAYRASSKQEQDDRRDDRRDVRIEDRDPGMGKSLLHG